LHAALTGQLVHRPHIRTIGDTHSKIKDIHPLDFAFLPVILFSVLFLCLAHGLVVRDISAKPHNPPGPAIAASASLTIRVHHSESLLDDEGHVSVRLSTTPQGVLADWTEATHSTPSTFPQPGFAVLSWGRGCNADTAPTREASACPNCLLMSSIPCCNDGVRRTNAPFGSCDELARNSLQQSL
jgi:hypothetical protein